MEEKKKVCNEAINNFIKCFDEEDREGLRDTPKRVANAYCDELFSGYNQDPEQILSRVFTERCNEMVILKDIDFTSHCEHHLLPFKGRAHIGYIPDGKVVGISKLARLVDCFAKRMQIQERMGEEIADSIQKYLNPLGCGVVIEGRHMCMTIRGVKKENCIMITSALRGIFRKPDPDKPGSENARQEFLSLVLNNRRLN